MAESARNRGLKLVRSRVRTPGKRRFGKVGLVDSSGKAVIGMDAKGPTATPDAIEDYLRSATAKDWTTSLGGRRPRRRAAPKASKRTEPEPAAPQIREARPADAPAIAALVAPLGHTITEAAVRENLARLRSAKELPLVAIDGDKVVGLCGLHVMVAVHRDRPVGRITVLVVGEGVQGNGLGRSLLQAAEAQLKARGCGLVEITSNDRLKRAHQFYRHLGYERTSLRFVKAL